MTDKKSPLLTKAFHTGACVTTLIAQVRIVPEQAAMAGRYKVVFFSNKTATEGETVIAERETGHTVATGLKLLDALTVSAAKVATLKTHGWQPVSGIEVEHETTAIVPLRQKFIPTFVPA
ncbi:MAG: hypothetical protein WCD70_15960 [Alphaproteobacteria bacterium]